MRTYMARCALR